MSVVDPTVTSPPVVSFDSPTDGDVITGPTSVIGTVADAHLLSYTLSVAPFGSACVHSDRPAEQRSVSHGLLGQFDPSLLPNDNYVLRLDAKNTGGRETIVDDFVSVSGNFKLGNFTLSFTDLTMPVAGIPITVSRTYDTLNFQPPRKTSAMAGGWSSATSTCAPMSRTTSDEEDLIYNPFQDGTRVFVTLPGGRREGFTFHVTPAPGLLGGFLGILYPSFTPDAGVTDQLSVPQTRPARRRPGRCPRLVRRHTLQLRQPALRRPPRLDDQGRASPTTSTPRAGCSPVSPTPTATR